MIVENRWKDAVDPAVPAVILKRVGDRLAHGGLAVARSLGRLGIPVAAVADPGWLPGSRSRYLVETVEVDTAAPAGAVIDALLQLGERLGNRPVLCAIDDVAAFLLDDHSDELAETFRFPARPDRLVHDLADKGRLAELCRIHDIATPTTVPLSDATLADFIGEFGFPVVIKAADPELLHRTPGVASVAVANDRDELRQIIEDEQGALRSNLLLQEYVPGGPETIWMFNGYFNRDSRCLVGFTGQKIRQDPPGKGPTTLGVCHRNDEVVDASTKFLRSVGYTGIVDMGVRFDARDGSYKLLDVNPRIGGTFRLFVGSNGLDVARALHLDLTDRPVPPTELIEGRRWVVESFDPSTWPAYHRVRTVPDLVRSFRRVEEGAWYASDDLAPFTSMLADRAASGVRKRLSSSPRPLGASAEDRAPTAIRAYFDHGSEAWDDIYAGSDVFSLIHQERLARTQRLIDGLCLPTGTRVLEIGCGAGHLTAWLAHEGYAVTATDTSERMIGRAEDRLARAGLGGEVATRLGDAHDLPDADGRYDLVVALGVLPWLHDPSTALKEIARVVSPGGFVIANIDNVQRLNIAFDPLRSPRLARPRRAVKRWLRPGSTMQPTGVEAAMHSHEEFDAMLSDVGLERLEGADLGYGPFTFAGANVLPGRAGIRVHRWLQSLSDRRSPVIARRGAQYLVLARKT